MKTAHWLVLLAPGLLGVGLAIYFFLSYDAGHDHIVYLRADLGTVSLLLGLGLSFLAALGFTLRERLERMKPKNICSHPHHQPWSSCYYSKM